jgi:hypothetical protein
MNVCNVLDLSLFYFRRLTKSRLSLLLVDWRSCRVLLDRIGVSRLGRVWVRNHRLLGRGLSWHEVVLLSLGLCSNNWCWSTNFRNETRILSGWSLKTTSYSCFSFWRFHLAWYLSLRIIWLYLFNLRSWFYLLHRLWLSTSLFLEHWFEISR